MPGAHLSNVSLESFLSRRALREKSYNGGRWCRI